MYTILQISTKPIHKYTKNEQPCVLKQLLKHVHNLTQFYTTLHNYSQFDKTLQHFTHIYKTLQHFTKQITLQTTIHNCTQPYTILHKLPRLYETLPKPLYVRKTIHNFEKHYTITHTNDTQLNTTIITCTRTSQNFTELYKTLQKRQNIRNKNTILHNSTQLYKTLKVFTILYTPLLNLTNFATFSNLLQS